MQAKHILIGFAVFAGLLLVLNFFYINTLNSG